jgi:hypothetical protein
VNKQTRARAGRRSDMATVKVRKDMTPAEREAETRAAMGLEPAAAVVAAPGELPADVVAALLECRGKDAALVMAKEGAKLAKEEAEAAAEKLKTALENHMPADPAKAPLFAGGDVDPETGEVTGA